MHGFGHQIDATKTAIISGLEMACWDIVGKDAGKPVYELLGGAVRDRIRTYTYVYNVKSGGEVKKKSSGKTKTPTFSQRAAVDAENILQCLDAGFTAVKLDPLSLSLEYDDWKQFVPINLSRESLHLAEMRFEKMRAAVGDRIDIGIGTHGQMSASSAIRLAKRLEPFDPFFFEEPVPPDNIDEMADVARKTSIRIATGERLSSLYEYNQVLQKGAARLLQFDIGRMGGILQAKKAAAIAEAHYAHIAPHYWGGPILMAANIQIDTCCLNFEVQECLGKMDGLWADILLDPIEWKRGFIIPSKRPGLGYEINEAVATKNCLK